MTTDSPRPSPGYREPLVWMVLAVPAATVVAKAVMLVLANAPPGPLEQEQAVGSCFLP